MQNASRTFLALLPILFLATPAHAMRANFHCVNPLPSRQDDLKSFSVVLNDTQAMLIFDGENNARDNRFDPSGEKVTLQVEGDRGQWIGYHGEERLEPARDIVGAWVTRAFELTLKRAELKSSRFSAEIAISKPDVYPNGLNVTQVDCTRQ